MNADATSLVGRFVLGPVVTREGGFAFDCWTSGEGLRSGYVYRRVEDAQYARYYEIRVHRNRAGTVACRTVDEFEQSVG
jgi:hypothetical protein